MRHLGTGLCLTHRKMHLQGEELRPLAPRKRQQSPTCTGPECSRPTVAHDLCKAHGKQQRENGELHVIGDKAHKSAVSRQAWQRKSPEEQRAHIAKMLAARPQNRPEEHRQNHAKAARAAWERKFENASPRERNCLCCGELFTVKPKLAGKQYYCAVECRRLYSRLRRYGLSYRQYQDLLEKQGGACALCRGAWKGWATKEGPHVDHCHTTGRVRGLLCGDCNTAIGRFGDDPVLLRAAAAYLETATL